MKQLFSHLHTNGVVVNVIREVPQPKQGKVKSFDPMGLPIDKRQCVHVEWVKDNEDSPAYPKRCVADAVRHGSPNGFLCPFHLARVIRPKQVQPRTPAQYAQEHIDLILGVEARALKGVERETVWIGPKISISFVKGLRLKADTHIDFDDSELEGVVL